MPFHIKLFTTIISLALLLSSCQKKFDLTNFDETTWQSDYNGCQKARLASLNQLEEVKDQLKGLDQKEIVELLGKPEAKELYKRSQKFFIYNISPGADCSTNYNGENITLNIRFNATGLAKEVLIYKN